MKYINSDLDFIFIRAKNKKGKWDGFSVRELNKQQWEDYLIRKFGNGKKFWKSINTVVDIQEWNDSEKLEMLNWLAKQGVVFYMIRRGKTRKNYKN